MASDLIRSDWRRVSCRTAGTGLLLSLIAAGACRPMSQSTMPGNSAFGLSRAGKTVCDPFGHGGGVGGPHGLFARLYSLDRATRERFAQERRRDAGAPSGLPAVVADNEPGDHGYQGVNDFQARGKRHDADLYFSELNISPRAFDKGFVTDDGTVLKGDNGAKVSNFFSLQFESMLRLMPHDPEGHYQFALLADDGAVMRIRQDDGNYTVIVDNDGDHATRLGCAAQSVAMTRDMSLQIQVDYFQGPNEYVALALLWRQVDPSDPASLSDPLCGETGTNLFFDPSKIPSAPMLGWQQLTDRGWRVIGPRNLYMPSHVGGNPCVTPEPSPTVTESPSPSPSPEPSPSPSPSPSPEPSPTVTADPSPSPSPSPTPIPTGTPCVGVGCGGGELGV